jgi:hypothetical protein
VIVQQPLPRLLEQHQVSGVLAKVVGIVNLAAEESVPLFIRHMA